MEMKTRYLGLDLEHPFVPGASPLADDLGGVRRLEDGGAAAIVLRSLFEEQITRDAAYTAHHLEANTDAFAEAASFLPAAPDLRFGPEQYLEHVAAVKAAVAIPVIASLNGVTPAGWLEHARLIEQAGADALELNVYYLAADPHESEIDVERRTIDLVAEVRRQVRIPLTVKLSPFHSSLTYLAARLVDAGAQGLVLFNRFYQPDIDLDTLDVVPRLHLSDPTELLLRLRWLAILSGRVSIDLACSGGVHGPTDVIKALMTGATVVQVVSALLRHGPGHLARLRADVDAWLEEREYESLDQLRGSMNLSRCPDPGAYERGNYMRVLASWRPPSFEPGR
jgi:dihydroorotate dehydrogenase (fumarate)